MVKWNRQKCLSKAIWRVRYYSDLRFYKDWISICGIIGILHNGTILQKMFLFQAYLKHFGQMKQTNDALVKLFEGFETTCISIFIRIVYIYVVLWAFIINVLYHKIFFFNFLQYIILVNVINCFNKINSSITELSNK